MAQRVFALDADMVVAIDGSGGLHQDTSCYRCRPCKSVGSTHHSYLLKNGVYNTEKTDCALPIRRNISLIGESRDQTIISYHIYDCTSPESGNKCPAADAALWSGDVIRNLGNAHHSRRRLPSRKT